jgi:imidazolonepropionase-like amidohydrolase
MRQNKSQSVLALGLAILLFSVSSMSWLPIAVRADGGEAIALRGATVVTVTGATIQKGTVIVRNGLIEAVGAEITIPADARVIDATGLVIYPGLFDSYTNLGVQAPAAASGPASMASMGSLSPGGQGGRGQAAPTAPGSGLLPEISVVDQLQIGPTTFESQRAAGITTVLTGPRGGVFQGRSAVINLGDESADKLILKTPFSLNIGFGGARGAYPGSPMGVFAFLRQSLLDARHYQEEWSRYRVSPRGATRPELNRSMEALQPVINGEMPVIFNVATVREMKRAIALAEEFNLKYLLSGGLQSYQIADYLKSKKATVLLSLSFPQKPAGLEDPESESLRTLRERAEAPTAAAALSKAGVTFAFTSGGLTRPADFIINAQRAIQAGLSKEEALRALTIYPARILGLNEQLGSIEKGKIANLVLTTGDLFDRNTQVKHVFIDGRKFDIKAESSGPGARPNGPAGQGGPNGPAGRNRGGAAAPQTALAASPAAGVWSVVLQAPGNEITATLNLKQDGEAVSGEVVTPHGTARISEGRLAGNELTLGYSLNVEGQQIQIVSRGRIDGDNMRGTMQAMGQNFSFSGSRRPN